jgi:serine acetyltransferase
MADLGDRVTVSAGAVIAIAVPDGATVAGNPARIIRTASMA